MKTLILGDIHGRPYWRQIVEKEQPNLTIFLGDFVTTHENYSPEDQLRELKAILDFKDQHPDDVIILRGNHDLDGLGYYWAQCYPSAADVRSEMNCNTELGKRFLANSQWIYPMLVGVQPTICSHAGVSRQWLKNILKVDKFVIEEINALEPSENFGFTGDRWDSCGMHPDQSCTWIRPGVLQECAVECWDQIVGHTGTYDVCKCIPTYVKNGDRLEESGNVIWLCDALQQKAYLTIEGDKYIPKTL